jgi:hypothetical protein
MIRRSSFYRPLSHSGSFLLLRVKVSIEQQILRARENIGRHPIEREPALELKQIIRENMGKNHFIKLPVPGFPSCAGVVCGMEELIRNCVPPQESAI